MCNVCQIMLDAAALSIARSSHIERTVVSHYATIIV